LLGVNLTSTIGFGVIFCTLRDFLIGFTPLLADSMDFIVDDLEIGGLNKAIAGFTFLTF
jgi:hypothetical protein